MTEHFPDRFAPPADDVLPAPRRRRSPWRRALNATLGAASAGGAAWLAVFLAEPPAFVVPWFIGGLAVVGAALGYRHGRGVVRAAGASLLEAGLD